MGIYVMQVMGGRERAAADLVNKHVQSLIKECFIPSYELMKRLDGQWRKVTELLFPGYLFIETDDPDAVAALLRRAPMFMKLLSSSNDAFIPLTPSEVAWLEAFTTAKTHVVEMSTGVIEGDTVIVTDGPLKGHEAQITKINRHKRLAYLDMHMFGRTKSVRIGLEIVRKR